MVMKSTASASSDFFDPWLLENELAEANQQLLERGQVHRLAPAHTIQGGEDSGLLPPSETLLPGQMLRATSEQKVQQLTLLDVLIILRV